MKARRFDEVLRARGYKCQERSEYQGLNIYVKEHKFNRITCCVEKDSHGKAIEMTFVYSYPIKPEIGAIIPMNMTEFKEAEFDRGYLTKEAEKIYEAFEQLKNMKAPKHLYCF